MQKRERVMSWFEKWKCPNLYISLAFGTAYDCNYLEQNAVTDMVSFRSQKCYC